VEYCQGPCEANQEVLITCDVHSILQSVFENFDEGELEDILEACLKMMLAIVEGRAERPLTNMMPVTFVEKLMSLVNEKWIVTIQSSLQLSTPASPAEEADVVGKWLLMEEDDKNMQRNERRPTSLEIAHVGSSSLHVCANMTKQKISNASLPNKCRILSTTQKYPRLKFYVTEILNGSFSSHHLSAGSCKKTRRQRFRIPCDDIQLA